MRPLLALLIALVPSVAVAQPDAKKATIKWVLEQEVPAGGFLVAPQPPNIDAVPQPSLRATSAAVRTLKYLGAEIPNKDKHAAFVLKCFDPKTGGFAEPGGKPDVATTSIGVMAAVEMDIPKEKFAKAMDYLKENAKTFEDVRIGAAAVEAWGVKDCPFKLTEWAIVAHKIRILNFCLPSWSPSPSEPSRPASTIRIRPSCAWIGCLRRCAKCFSVVAPLPIATMEPDNFVSLRIPSSLRHSFILPLIRFATMDAVI